VKVIFLFNPAKFLAMNLNELALKYNTEEKCFAQLEKVRYGEKPCCNFCDSHRLTKRKHSIKWHCNACNKDSTRDIGVTYKTAWYSAMRVRCAMLDWGEQLEGIVEMDETYIGGKPRKRNQQGVTADNEANLGNVYQRDDKRLKRGRGTKKVAVAGIIERKGKVVAKVMDRLTSQELIGLLKKAVKIKDSTLMTDDFRSYQKMDEIIERFVIQHSQKEYARGAIHTNTIEGFWSIIKNGIRGQYHVISKKYLPFYLAEFTYRYNRRQLTISDSFNETIDK
jgi:transposase-like protein